MLQLQQENAQLQQMVAQLQQQLGDYSDLVAQSQDIIDRDIAEREGQEEMSPEELLQGGMPNQQTAEELQGMDVSGMAEDFM